MTKPFHVQKSDGTDHDLTGMTVTWKFKDRDNSVSSITGTITNATTGRVSFVIPDNS